MYAGWEGSQDIVAFQFLHKLNSFIQIHVLNSNPFIQSNVWWRFGCSCVTKKQCLSVSVLSVPIYGLYSLGHKETPSSESNYVIERQTIIWYDSTQANVLNRTNPTTFQTHEMKVWRREVSIMCSGHILPFPYEQMSS